MRIRVALMPRAVLLKIETLRPLDQFCRLYNILRCQFRCKGRAEFMLHAAVAQKRDAPADRVQIVFHARHFVVRATP